MRVYALLYALAMSEQRQQWAPTVCARTLLPKKSHAFYGMHLKRPHQGPHTTQQQTMGWAAMVTAMTRAMATMVS